MLDGDSTRVSILEGQSVERRGPFAVPAKDSKLFLHSSSHGACGLYRSFTKDRNRLFDNVQNASALGTPQVDDGERGTRERRPPPC
jgi:hypothetical protein